MNFFYPRCGLNWILKNGLSCFCASFGWAREGGTWKMPHSFIYWFIYFFCETPKKKRKKRKKMKATEKCGETISIFRSALYRIDDDGWCVRLMFVDYSNRWLTFTFWNCVTYAEFNLQFVRALLINLWRIESIEYTLRMFAKKCSPRQNSWTQPNRKHCQILKIASGEFLKILKFVIVAQQKTFVGQIPSETVRIRFSIFFSVEFTLPSNHQFAIITSNAHWHLRNKNVQ